MYLIPDLFKHLYYSIFLNNTKIKIIHYKYSFCFFIIQSRISRCPKGQPLKKYNLFYKKWNIFKRIAYNHISKENERIITFYT